MEGEGGREREQQGAMELEHERGRTAAAGTESVKADISRAVEVPIQTLTDLLLDFEGSTQLHELHGTGMNIGGGAPPPPPR